MGDNKEFTPINSQEELDNVIKDRLNRQSEKHSKELEEVKSRYADYESLKSAKADYETKLNELTEQLSSATEKVKGYDSIIAEKDAQIKTFEVNALKNRIISERGLSPKAIDFLKGETEEELIASADGLTELVSSKRVAPLAGVGGTDVPDARTQALKSMLNNLSN